VIVALLAVITVPSFEALGTNLAMVMNKVAYAECQATETICLMVAPN
jgi:hypothetical protein